MIIKLTCLTKDLPLNNPNVIILQRFDKGEVKCMDTSCISDPVKCNTHNQKRTLSCKYPKGCHAMTCSITKMVTATLVVWDVSDRKMNTCERYGESWTRSQKIIAFPVISKSFWVQQKTLSSIWECNII